MEFDRDGSAGYLTNWAARLLARAIERKLKPLGLSSGHLPVYFALAGGRSLTQKQLAAHAGTEQPTMAATLSRMERDGLIERTPDPKDRRSSLVRLSALAQQKEQAVLDAVHTTNAEALARLEPDEREQYRVTLRTIIATLKADLGD
jgi:MarR family transcriptional regulator, transcriptional regulator for hemolysin